jgi:beta-N-acetylhexosaminidase
LPTTRREVLGALIATGASALTTSCAQSTDPIATHIAEMLMLCFWGSTTRSISALLLANHLSAGRIGGVVFDKSNVGSREDVAELINLFSSSARTVPLIAIDHEGGSVQRLDKKRGFSTLPSARTVAQTLSVDEARDLYSRAAEEFAALGFNLNLGPVVDLYDRENPAIGRFGRAYDSDPATVVAYADAFIDAFSSAKVLCSPKHFPGQGLARGDSHWDLPDITRTWSERELEPYARLIESGRARIIMGGHVLLSTMEREPVPTTLSRAVTHGLLRERLGYEGVVLTDSLDMFGVAKIVSRKEAVLKAISAGNDLLMIKNVVPFDPFLPQNVVTWIREAIESGALNERDIVESADRIRKLKNGLSGEGTHDVASAP